jgi:hypothetical protein
LSGVTPNVLDFLGRYRLTIYEAIQERLVDGIGKLGDNGIDFLRKAGY